MATKAETIYHHICDLCGQERGEDELAQRPQIDICPECRRKPVSGVLAWFEQQTESSSLRRRSQPQGQPKADADRASLAGFGWVSGAPVAAGLPLCVVGWLE